MAIIFQTFSPESVILLRVNIISTLFRLSLRLVGTAGRTGIMFLNEVALGKEKTITADDWRLTKAPPGYDCIVARGQTEPGKFPSPKNIRLQCCVQFL